MLLIVTSARLCFPEMVDYIAAHFTFCFVLLFKKKIGKDIFDICYYFVALPPR